MVPSAVASSLPSGLKAIAPTLLRAKESRPDSGNTHDKEYVEWGAGPRASQSLILGAKSLALIRGLPAPSCQEVRDVALPVLRHRIIPNYNATGRGIDASGIVRGLLQSVPEPDYSGKSKKAKPPALPQMDLVDPGSPSPKSAGGPDDLPERKKGTVARLFGK